MRFLHPAHDEELELSTDDVFLNPGYFDGGSRLDTDLSPPDFPGCSHPIVSANMNAVTGKRMAETMARFGGLGVLPQDMDLDTVVRTPQGLKFESRLVVYDSEMIPNSLIQSSTPAKKKRCFGMSKRIMLLKGSATKTRKQTRCTRFRMRW